MTATIPMIYPEPIEEKILTIRGLRVMMDSDLAELYMVETKVLNQAVKRNPERFPQAFMFQLTQAEVDSSRSQIVTWNKPFPDAEDMRSQIVTSKGKGGRRYLPFAFTEHGVLMLANVLKSHRAIAVSIQIIEAFVRLRQMVLSVPEIAKKLEEIEARLAGQEIELNIFRDIVFPLLTSNLPKTRRKAGFKPGGAE